jgi:hypothetical protein
MIKHCIASLSRSHESGLFSALLCVLCGFRFNLTAEDAEGRREKPTPFCDILSIPVYLARLFSSPAAHEIKQRADCH